MHSIPQGAHLGRKRRVRTARSSSGKNVPVLVPLWEMRGNMWLSAKLSRVMVLKVSQCLLPEMYECAHPCSLSASSANSQIKLVWNPVFYSLPPHKEMLTGGFSNTCSEQLNVCAIFSSGSWQTQNEKNERIFHPPVIRKTSKSP